MSFEIGPESEHTQQPTAYDQLVQIRQTVEAQSPDATGAVVTVPLVIEGTVHELRVGTIAPVDEDESDPPIFFHIDNEWLRADPDGTVTVHNKQERGFYPADSSRIANLGSNLLDCARFPESA